MRVSNTKALTLLQECHRHGETDQLHFSFSANDMDIHGKLLHLQSLKQAYVTRSQLVVGDEIDPINLAFVVIDLQFSFPNSTVLFWPSKPHILLFIWEILYSIVLLEGLVDVHGKCYIGW